MFEALGRAVSDLGRARVLSIMLQTLAISLLVFVLLGAFLAWLLGGSDPCSLVGLGSCLMGAGSSVIGAIVLTLLGAWFLFPAVAITVMTGFADRIAGTVENLHYPDAASRAHPIGIGHGLLLGLKSAGRLVIFNMIALPFYVFLLVTGIGPFILFIIVNGIAFGRDIAELAAARHGDRQSRREWLRRTRVQQLLIGIAVSVLFLVPFANLAAPVIGTAAGIHLFNGSFWAMRPGKNSSRT